VSLTAMAMPDDGLPAAQQIMGLLASLEDESPDVRLRASGCLYWAVAETFVTHSTVAFPSILRARAAAERRAERWVQINLQQVLSLYGVAAIPHLVEDLRSPARELRSGAAISLGMMGAAGREALEPLRRAHAVETDTLVGHYMAGAIQAVQR
jgi:hypothetical protein